VDVCVVPALFALCAICAITAHHFVPLNGNQSKKKLKQFTKLLSQNSKMAKMVLGRYYCVLNSRLAFTRLAILNT